MAIFNKADLKHNYNWNSNDNAGANYRDFYDQVRINKTEGNEVLYFCEKFLEVHSLAPSVENFNRVETLLKSTTAAPLEMRLKLYNFIALHWTNSDIDTIYNSSMNQDTNQSNFTSNVTRN